MMLTSAALSSSYAPFEAQLEGCILQHTAAVDLYLQSAPAASTWAAPPRASLSGATSKRELYDLFQADMASTMWQAFVAPHHGEPFHLEVDYPMAAPPSSRTWQRRERSQPLGTCGLRHLDRFLEQDLHNYLEQQQTQQPQLPGDGPEMLLAGVEDDDGASLLLAGAAAVAAAMAAATAHLSDAVSPAASVLSLQSLDGSPRAQPATSVPDTTEAVGPTAAAATPAPTTWEEEQSELAEQKAAARQALAAPQLDERSPAEVAAAKAKGLDDDGLHGGEQHQPPGKPLVVPERPRGLRPGGPRAALYGESGRPLYGVTKGMRLPELNRLYLGLLNTFVVGMLLLPLLWLRSPWVLMSPEQQGRLLARLHAIAGVLFVPTAAALALWPGALMGSMRMPLLQFASCGLEERFMLWLSGKRVAVDAAFYSGAALVSAMCWMRHGLQPPPLLAAHMAPGVEPTAAPLAWLSPLAMVVPLLPCAAVLCLRSQVYMRHREQLLVAARLCVTAAQLYFHQMVPVQGASISMPFMALTQLTSAACMQVRLVAFVPAQLLHMVVVLTGVAGSLPLLVTGMQLLCFGLCLPCLLVYSVEVYSRKAFLASAWARAAAA